MLYIVATPIGNLSDITIRAIEVLSEIDIVLCEDTRQTQKILNHFNITKPTLSYHQHSKLSKINQIIDLLKQGKKLALVSDAGTPGISDPGNKLISELIEKGVNVKIVPIPGPSALTTALSISGFATDKFQFLGFPPHKKGRDKFFKNIKEIRGVAVFYESPYRIIKALEQLSDVIGSRKVVVCRELTKIFESIYRGTCEEVLEQLKSDLIKGEFVIVVDRSQKHISL